jgi:hypothetical protein
MGDTVKKGFGENGAEEEVLEPGRIATKILAKVDGAVAEGQDHGIVGFFVQLLGSIAKTVEAARVSGVGPIEFLEVTQCRFCQPVERAIGVDEMTFPVS